MYIATSGQANKEFLVFFTKECSRRWDAILKNVPLVPEKAEKQTEK
jgi:hypothetical protein